MSVCYFFFFFQAEDGIRDVAVTGVQTCALPISPTSASRAGRIGQRATVTRLPSGLRFRRTSVHRLRGDRVLDGAAGAFAVHEREEQGRRGWEALERHRSGPDPAGDFLGGAYGSVTHDHPGAHWRDA